MINQAALHPNSTIKYPRTPHLPSSPGVTSDDKRSSPEAITYLSSGINLVVTEKMDGGGLTFCQDHFYGRSVDSGTHVWDTMARALWAQVHRDIPIGWRISGESMQARRSVGYDNLPGPFLVFGIWDEYNVLLSWDDTQEFADLLDLPVVPVLYQGQDFKEATTVWGKSLSEENSEGFVIRDAGRIAYGDFPTKVSKWVRKDHVQTSDNWRHRDDFKVNTFLEDK